MAAKKKKAMSPEIMGLIDQEIDKDEANMEEAGKKIGDTVPDLITKANEFANVCHEVDELEAKVKELKSRKDQLRKDIIPAMMKKAGLVDSKGKGSFTIPGCKIFLENRVNASVTEANKAAVFKWLRRNKHGDMIKEVVHPSTMSAFARAMREDGKTLHAGISVHEETVAKLMKKD